MKKPYRRNDSSVDVLPPSQAQGFPLEEREQSQRELQRADEVTRKDSTHFQSGHRSMLCMND